MTKPDSDISLESLRRQWQQVTIKAEKLEATNAELTRRLKAERAGSVRDRLARRFRAQTILSAALPLLAALIYFENMVSAPFAIIYGVFGLIMCVSGIWFTRYVKHSDFIACPTVEALHRAYDISRWRQRFRIMGWLMALIVVVWLFIEMAKSGNDSAMIGACVGLAIGLPIGIYKEIVTARLTRRMLKELEDDPDAQGGSF